VDRVFFAVGSGSIPAGRNAKVKLFYSFYVYFMLYYFFFLYYCVFYSFYLFLLCFHVHF